MNQNYKPSQVSFGEVHPACTDGRTVGEDGKYSEKMVVKNREGAYVAFSVYGVSEQSVIR